MLTGSWASRTCNFRNTQRLVVSSKEDTDIPKTNEIYNEYLGADTIWPHKSENSKHSKTVSKDFVIQQEVTGGTGVLKVK